MACKKCGATTPKGSKFCPVCGERLDGKKICPKCESEIKEEFLYCPICGTRTDGKKVCEKCGEVYEGNFCPKCGTGKKEKEVKSVQEKESITFAKVADILNPSLFLVVSVLLFVGSFFIGVSVLGIETLNFFTLISEFSVFMEMFKGMYSIPWIITLLGFIANIIATLIALILVAVKYYKKVAKKEDVKFMGCVLTAFGFSIMATVLPSTVCCGIQDEMFNLSAGTIAIFIIALIIIFATISIEEIARKVKQTALKNTRSALSGVLVGFGAVLIPFTALRYIVLYGELKMSAIGVFTIIGTLGKSVSPGNATLIAFMGYLAQLGLIVCLLIVMAKALKGEYVGEKQSSGLVPAILAFVFSIANVITAYFFVFNASVVDMFADEIPVMYTDTVVNCVMTGLFLAVAIARFVFIKLNNKKQENLNN